MAWLNRPDVPSGGGGGIPLITGYRESTAATTFFVDDMVLVVITTVPVVVSMLPLADYTLGQWAVIKNAASSTATVTVQADGAELIDSANSVVLNADDPLNLVVGTTVFHGRV